MLDKLIKFRKGMTGALNFCLIVAVALLVVDVIWGVFTRYVMGEQAKWTEELARFLLIWVSLLGGAVAFGTRGHLGVDYFVGKFHPDARKLMTIIGHLIVLFFAGSVFLYGGGTIVKEALQLEQVTPALGWKMGHIYLALPISGIFMVIYTLENLVVDFLTPAGDLHEPEAEASE